MELDILGEFEDRRKTARTKVLQSGVALTIDGAQREACVIDNLSETGALLFVERPEQLPDDLILVIDGESNKRPAHVIRRKEDAVAVSFVTRNTAETQDSGWVFPPDQDKD
ncbi:PilZ domain-containing protein [Anderseniella sp. Alg231-50]|uniref:PilZ domain-containing protein n=1 Tax=Anderseniella sp. Alg231-50 TaxID=1922226 RepID=UPI000D551A9E